MVRRGHTPLRMCRICRSVKPQNELTRWVSRGTWVKDESRTEPGRGVYTCSARCKEILTTKFGKK